MLCTGYKHLDQFVKMCASIECTFMFIWSGALVVNIWITHHIVKMRGLLQRNLFPRECCWLKDDWTKVEKKLGWREEESQSAKKIFVSLIKLSRDEEHWWLNNDWTAGEKKLWWSRAEGVAKCHRYDRYIHIEIFACWGKFFAKSSLFGVIYTTCARFPCIN